MKKYCINLDRRIDRWEEASNMFYLMGWNVKRFSALERDKGWIGCRDSHLAILRMERGLGNVFMILEDDVVLTPLTNYVVEEAMSQLPLDWDMLYLGCSPKEPQERYSDSLFRLKNAHVTHAIIWNDRESGAINYILNHVEEIEKIDDYFATVIQPKFNCFVVYPIVATQSDSPSDIAKHSDVSTIIYNYKQYCQ
jgi:GR25 family glycosyltransferase involved in LPS biosynthesis